MKAELKERHRDATDMKITRRIGRFLVNQPHLINWGIGAAIVALPVVVWMDLMAITDQSLRRQGQALDAVLDTVRSYYAPQCDWPLESGRVHLCHP